MQIKIDDEEWSFDTNNMSKYERSDLTYIKGKLDILVNRMTKRDANAALKKISPNKNDGHANLKGLFENI